MNDAVASLGRMEMPMSRELQLHQTSCPHCNARLTTATSVNGEDQPRAGAMSLCSYCGEWCAFDENLDLVKPTQAQIDYIAVCPVARTMRRTFDTLAGQEDRPPALVMQKEVFERGLEQVPPRPPLAIHRTLH